MPQFSGLPRAILVAVSTLAGDEYRWVDDDDLTAELERMGHTPSRAALDQVTSALKEDGFLDFDRDVGGALFMLRLGSRGRQQVEGWPTAGSVTGADFDAFVALLAERADDPNIPEEERTRLRKAYSGLKDVGKGVGIGLLTTWIETQTGLS